MGKLKKLSNYMSPSRKLGIGLVFAKYKRVLSDICTDRAKCINHNKPSTSETYHNSLFHPKVILQK